MASHRVLLEPENESCLKKIASASLTQPVSRSLASNGSENENLAGSQGFNDNDLAYMVMHFWAHTQLLFERLKATERLLVLDIDKGPRVCGELLTAFLERPVR